MTRLDLDAQPTSNKYFLQCITLLYARRARFRQKILFTRTLIVEFSKVAICVGYSFIHGAWNFIVALEK